jgi:hypothetical protein
MSTPAISRRSLRSSEAVHDRRVIGGGKYVTGAATYLGDFIGITAHTAAVVTLTGNVDGATTPGVATAVAIPAGMYFPGRFSSIVLTSGTITMHYAK